MKRFGGIGLLLAIATPLTVATNPTTTWFGDSFGSYDPDGYGLALQNAAPNWTAAPEGGSNSMLRVVNYSTYDEGPDYDADGNYVEFKGDSHVGNDSHVQTTGNFAALSAGKIQVFHLQARAGFTPIPGQTEWYHASFAIRDAAGNDIACWAGGSLGLKAHLATPPINYGPWDNHYYGLLPEGWVGGPTPQDTAPGVEYLFPDANWHDFDIAYDPATGVTKWLVDGSATPLWTRTQAPGRAMNKIWVRDVCVHQDHWAWEDHVYVDQVSIGTGDLALAAYDFDSDGDVDQADFGRVQACLSGPDAPYVKGCGFADLDLDGHVDALDLNLFMPCMANPAQAPPPGC